MIEVREAESDDIEAACRIVGQLSPGQPHDYRDAVEKFERHIRPSPDYYLWVAVEDGVVIGTAMMHLQHKLSYRCGTAAHLEDVVVDASARGRGAGRMLVQTAIDTARRHGCYKIMLTCFEKTTRYYEPFGFERHDIGMRMTLKEALYA
ncbi:MAG: GNAT family N-acetyltransferase [Phycisphaera sp.]|nr:GNAT family N-acetyltransferase [Phycisphaera sp.]